VAEAEAGRRAAVLRVEAVRAQIRFRTREREAQLRAAERMATVYADGLLPQARLSYEASIASYQAGKVPFLTVLEALSTLYRDRIDHLRVLAAHERIKASIAEASLEATSEIPSSGGEGRWRAGRPAVAPPGPAAMSGSMGTEGRGHENDDEASHAVLAAALLLAVGLARAAATAAPPRRPRWRRSSTTARCTRPTCPTARASVPSAR